MPDKNGKKIEMTSLFSYDQRSYDEQKAVQWRSYDLMRALKIANGKNHSLTLKN